LKKRLRDYFVLFLIAILIIIADQVTKTIIRQNLEYAQMWIPFGLEWLYPYFYFVHWYNTGAAFGMFQDASTIFTVLAIIVSALIIYYFPKISDEDWHMRFALSLQLGGAIGNLIDRLTIGHVTDFIAVGNFPIFNVADASISIGVAVLIISMWFKEKEKEKTTQAEQPEMNDKF
jgi:signal peptidase II